MEDRALTLIRISLVRFLLSDWLLLGGGAAVAAGQQTSPATYIGSQNCTGCHAAEAERWRGYYHDLAMSEATEATVLGDFRDAEISAHGVTSRFYRKDGRYFVRTDGPDGGLHDYAIAYTFGWWPLQQYLIELPGGRLQALGIAWDSRTKEAGGQRWFHLYPNERMDHTHRLHWTARDQNWNYQCAECHSTNLQKDYDLATDTFRTTWAEIDVACEACHGPGSRHIAQAQAVAGGNASAWGADKGLLVALGDRDGGVWTIDGQTGLPKRSVRREKRAQLEVCARCHSRRGQISERYEHGRPLGDTHRLALLDADLYHADGQIKDEVYEYGSFLQSRMHAEGVVCSDCHDAHSLKLKAPGNLVCTQCHLAAKYDTGSHHHHAPGTAGAACTACHMPQQRYMVVDERADHSLRVPRPDLSLKLGSPNACNACHQDKPVQWAADATRQWYGEALAARPHFGEALHAGRTGAPGAGGGLVALAADPTQPAIARATALDLLRGFPEPTHLLTIRRLLKDGDPLVRASAVRYLEVTDAKTLLELGLPLLADPVLAVRTEAAQTLAPLVRLGLPATQQKSLAAALDEYRATQRATAELPESHLNLGLLEVALGDAKAAEAAYRTALRLDRRFAPGYVNLADLYRALGQDATGEAVLRDGLAAVPEDASLYHALGLLQVRKKDLANAVGSLARAAELAPGNARYAYVHALAVQGTGDAAQAIALLEAALARHPNDRDILAALVLYHQQGGNADAAAEYAQQLKAQR
jgi:tetratricopeptide (TPR) repeat protein